MSWILLLIELIPTVLKIINLIMELIQRLPKGERPAARRELRQIARQNLRKKKGVRAYAVRTSEPTVVAELEALRDKLKLRVGA